MQVARMNNNLSKEATDIICWNLPVEEAALDRLGVVLEGSLAPGHARAMAVTLNTMHTSINGGLGLEMSVMSTPFLFDKEVVALQQGFEALVDI